MPAKSSEAIRRATPRVPAVKRHTPQKQHKAQPGPKLIIKGARKVQVDLADLDLANLDRYSYLHIFRADPLARVEVIKQGVPAGFLDQLARAMAMPKERLLPALGISSATVNRKVRENKPLSIEDGERALGLGKLVGQVQSMVEESGNPEGFNAAQWLARWIEEPTPALGGRKPADLMDTTEGQSIVSSLLAKAQSGAYA